MPDHEPRHLAVQPPDEAHPTTPPAGGPPPAGALHRFGHWTARHRRAVALTWLVAVVLGFATATGRVGGESLFDRLTSGPPSVPGEATAGRDLLTAQEDRGPELLLTLDHVDPADPQIRSVVTAALADLSRTPGVQRVTSAYGVPGGLSSPAARSLVATDGHGLLVVVDLEPHLTTQDATVSAVETRLGQVQPALRAAGQTQAVGRVGGTLQLVHDITHQVEVDLRTGEGIALPVSLLVMVLVFGGFLAAGMPLAGAIASIAGALASLLAFTHVIDLDASVVNVVTVLGLGLCIDYGLLIVSRFREELRRAAPDGEPDREVVDEAVARTVAVAGRTVLFSGLTVAISLAGLMVVPASILRAVGAAGVSVVVVALLVALTLVPALVALSGARMIRPGLPSRVPFLRRLVNRLGDVAPEHGVFSRIARAVQRHPAVTALAVLAVLVLLAAPALGLQLRSSGAELLPRGSAQRTFLEDLSTRFPASSEPDVTVVARAPVALVTSYAEELTRVPGVTGVTPPRQRGELVTVGVQMSAHSGSPAAQDLVRRLRAHEPGFPTWVIGQTAGLVDFSAAVRHAAPYAIGLVVLATFLLLFLMTGSVLVPVKALLMNLVSLGAAIGVLVWVFQDGHLQGPLGFASTGGIESSIPPLVLAFGFGLAMDYEVFLLSRIKELRDAGMDNDDAVRLGLQRSGRIITSAALLIVIVFAGFVAGQLVVIKQTGVALAVAVAFDATLVRILLVPATMTLLGEWNWWAPRPLRRLHDRWGMRE